MHTVSFTNDFEGDVADRWELEQGWWVGEEDGRFMLCGEGHHWARLRTGQQWTDYSVRLRLKLSAGGIHLCYRVSDQGRYFFGFREHAIYLSKEAPWGTFIELAAREIHHDVEVWHDVEVLGAGGQLQVSVNGELVLEVEDPDPLPNGGIALETLDDSRACAAEVRVTSAAEDWLQHVMDTNLAVQQYGFRLEFTPGVVYEGRLDASEDRQYIQLGIEAESFPQAEAYWTGEEGYGRHLEVGAWWRLRPERPPNYLQRAVQLLQAASIVAKREEGPFWAVELEVENLPFQDDPETFFRTLMGEPEGPEQEELLRQVLKLSREVTLQVEVRINREDMRIVAVEGRAEAGVAQVQLSLAMYPTEEPLPPLPDEALERVGSEPRIPMPMLLLRLPKLGGWCGLNHGLWMERSIKLIKDKDQYDQYAEIYDPAWFSQKYSTKTSRDHTKQHPLVQGAILEDSTEWEPKTGAKKMMPDFYDKWFASDANYKANSSYYFSQKPYGRDFHHYGGGNQGLEKRWYFTFYNDVTPTVGDRYYSARDWGFGAGRIKGHLNRLTFTQAIDQYYRYSAEGKRNAYLMLGHVVHLLQDQGQPDHAALVAHPGSSKTGSDILKVYCPIIAAEAALLACALCGIACLVCGLAGFATFGGICAMTIIREKFGYEMLIEQYWNLYDRYAADNEIDSTGIVKLANYDAHFAKLSKFSVDEAKKRKLEPPLGLGTLWVPPLPPVPGLNPQLRHKGVETTPYMQMTDALVPQIVCCSAGLMQQFYEIVNYPPILERVAIVQWEPKATPRAFAFFKKDPKKHCVRYHARWEMDSKAHARTLKQVVPTQALSPDRTAYIFLQFGPSVGVARDAKTGDIKAKVNARRMDLSKTTLRLVGTDPDTGKAINSEVKLKLALDPVTGPYYWGFFEPRNCSKDPYWLTLVVDGDDGGAHFFGRSPSGCKLDAKPATVARVDAHQYPKYPWVGGTYEPDKDKNHKIKIHTYEEWDLTVKPKQLVLYPARVMQGEVALHIVQKSRDCQWEPYYGPVTCPVQWKLLEDVTKEAYIVADEWGGLILYPPETGKPADFGFQVKLTVDSKIPEKADLEITADPQSYTPGTYDIYVGHAVGKKSKWIATTTIVVDLA
jgi:hypothetical protein